MKIKRYILHIVLAGLLVWALSQTIAIHILSREVEALAVEYGGSSAERGTVVRLAEKEAGLQPITVKEGLSNVHV